MRPQVLGLVETKDSDGQPRSTGDISADIAEYIAKTPVDGYYFSRPASFCGVGTVEGVLMR